MDEEKLLTSLKADNERLLLQAEQQAQLIESLRQALERAHNERQFATRLYAQARAALWALLPPVEQREQ